MKLLSEPLTKVVKAIVPYATLKKNKTLLVLLKDFNKTSKVCFVNEYSLFNIDLILNASEYAINSSIASRKTMQRARKMMTDSNLIAVNGSNLCVQLLRGTSVEIGEELNGAQVEVFRKPGDY